MNAEPADELRARMRAAWENAAAGWARRAEAEGDWAMPVSMWMLDRLGLQPGQRVLELAGGTGDTGFLAAELIRPGGTLIASDGAAAMLDVARQRAGARGLDNVEFRQLELEWIDLETATVDAILCRFGLMLTLDPSTALREMRRVLRPGGRVAVAVWDRREENPWLVLPGRALVELGYVAPPDPSAPGPFALSDAGRLAEMLEEAGFVEPTLDTVDLPREFASADAFLDMTIELSSTFATAWAGLDEPARDAVRERVHELVMPFAAADGALHLPARALLVAADA
jgi:SAM-dependent methyltransferase